MSEHTLLLFDVDGVLLYPFGYKQALQAAVDYFADQMSLPAVGLTYEEIALFEAAGMTNEWMSGALCLAALLAEATSGRPELIGSSVSKTISAIRGAHIAPVRPVFETYTLEALALAGESIHSTEPIIKALSERSEKALVPVLREILADIRPLAPFSHIFQHYALGHARYLATYGEEPIFECESYLANRDRSQLNDNLKSRLVEALTGETLRAAIYTARPGLPPRDLTEEEYAAVRVREHPPEANLAAELLGFDGRLPLISGGCMTWLAMRQGQHPGTFIKPSPLHALATIGAAQGGCEKAAVEAALAFTEKGQVSGPLAALKDQPARIVVFEDSIGGIRGIQQAARMLNRAGFNLMVEAVGIAPETSKRQALISVADRVIDDINAALATYLA
mgnify:CR=1 FL=1